MYIESVPNRSSPPAILLRESFRENGRVRKRTLANLSDWPTTLVEGFRTLLKGGVAVAEEGIAIRRALPHGHAAAVLGTIRAIGLDRLLGKPTDKRLAPLTIALIASRLVSPASKLATARDLAADTACSSLGRLLQLGAVDEVELYRALDWLGARQAAIEGALARRHLKDGALVLYDVSSSWLEGRCCELARFGYSRDGKKGKLQIVYGLLCAADGCPVAVEVFEGNTADPMTLSAQIDKLKERFGLSRVVLVGDRGMITSARIRDELRPAGLDWITALRAPQIRALVDAGAFQLSLFDERDLAEITAPDFPGERLVVCRNPLLAEERTRKREDLLHATEAALTKLADQIARGTGPTGQDKIARGVGRIENRYKLAKLFDITVAEDGFTFGRNHARIADEARLDGFYVIRTSVEDKALAAENVVGAYKSLARVERAFRSLKTVDLHLRPIHHWLAPRVRAHVFLCMLACHVEWHMRERLKPILFDDDDPAAAARERTSIVAPAQPSPAALRKRASKLTANGGPVHSFQSLLRDLATCTLNEMTTTLNAAYSFTLVATPTPIQAQAFRLLDVDPTKL
ncbi:MAG TPA: IS1634 family transposase [Stellaceae bacterium]|jgi:Transposase DDE domain|nr:IS1634 family transposase [Stellaceae bacterium]